MTFYRRQALLLLAVVVSAALIFGVIGAAAIGKTVQLARAAKTSGVSCGCSGMVGVTTVDRGQLVIAAVLAVTVTGLFLYAARKSVLLLRRTRALTAAPGTALGSNAGIYTAGLWRPQMVFPRRLQSRYRNDERSSIIAHERVHVRWHDPLLFFLFDACAALFLWVPGIDRVRRRFRLLIELDADAAALRRSGRKALGSALVKSLDRHTTLNPLAVSFFGVTEARLRRIVRLGVPLPWSAILVPLTVVGLTLAGLFAILPSVKATAVTSPPVNLQEYLFCVAQPQCHSVRPPHTQAQLHLFSIDRSPGRSFIVFYD